MKTQNKELRSIIRSLIEELLEEQSEKDISEMNTTANADGYETPHAFDKSEDEDGHAERIKDKAEVFDYKKTENSKNNTLSLNEGRSLYHLFRDHPDLSARQKIGVTMRHINNLLSEVDKVLKVSTKFKLENEVPSSSYWKTTTKYLNKLDGKIQSISRKIKDLK